MLGLRLRPHFDGGWNSCLTLVLMSVGVPPALTHSLSSFYLHQVVTVVITSGRVIDLLQIDVLRMTIDKQDVRAAHVTQAGQA